MHVNNTATKTADLAAPWAQHFQKVDGPLSAQLVVAASRQGFTF